MGIRDNFLYVDGAKIDDLLNFDDVNCYICIDSDGKVIYLIRSHSFTMKGIPAHIQKRSTIPQLPSAASIRSEIHSLHHGRRPST